MTESFFVELPENIVFCAKGKQSKNAGYKLIFPVTYRVLGRRC